MNEVGTAHLNQTGVRSEPKLEALGRVRAKVKDRVLSKRQNIHNLNDTWWL